MGLIAEKHEALYKVIEAAALTHGEGMQSYLCMMAVRLIELHRVLKDTGSIYLHCDPTASHYLKLLMDAVFRASRFRNEIVWQRTTAKGLASARFPSNHDVLLYYGKTFDTQWNPEASFLPYDPSNLDEKTASKYRYKDPDGRIYRLDNLINPNKDRPNLTYEFLGVTRVWRWTRERMQAAFDAGLVVQAQAGRVPQLKRYLDEQRGRPIGDIWGDVAPINSRATRARRLPPRRNPARCWNASSRPARIPAMWCWTRSVDARRPASPPRYWAANGSASTFLRGRRTSCWIAWDGPEYGSLFRRTWVTVRTDIPRRTDIDAPINYRNHRHELFGQQEGRCGGCRHEFPFRNFTVDHMIPRSRGGTDHLDNLQTALRRVQQPQGRPRPGLSDGPAPRAGGVERC